MKIWMTLNSYTGGQFGMLLGSGFDKPHLVFDPTPTYFDMTNTPHSSFDQESCLMCQVSEPLRAMQEAIRRFPFTETL